MKEKNKEAKVLGLTKNNDKYKNVPNDLKWAIPLIEIQTDPEFIRAENEEHEKRIQRLKKEKAAMRQPLKIISKFS